MRPAIVAVAVSLSLAACNDGETDPVFGASTVAEVTPARLAGWDQAARWGDHRDAGYLARAEFEAAPAAAITAAQVTSGSTATWTSPLRSFPPVGSSNPGIGFLLFHSIAGV